MFTIGHWSGLDANLDPRLVKHGLALLSEWQHIVLKNLYISFSINGALTDLQV